MIYATTPTIFQAICYYFYYISDYMLLLLLYFRLYVTTPTIFQTAGQPPVQVQRGGLRREHHLRGAREEQWGPHHQGRYPHQTR